MMVRLSRNSLPRKRWYSGVLGSLASLGICGIAQIGYSVALTGVWSRCEWTLPHGAVPIHFIHLIKRE